MAIRKIRVTMSSTKVDDIGALVDIDFNNENLDVDLDVDATYGETTLVKEYTVDATSGIHNLDFTFKNDGVYDSLDRNFYIEKIEIANNGVDYKPFIVTESDTNLELYTNFNPMGYMAIRNENYNPDLPKSDDNHPNLINPAFNLTSFRTDNNSTGYIQFSDPGDNAKYMYELKILPTLMWVNGTATFSITFTD